MQSPLTFSFSLEVKSHNHCLGSAAAKTTEAWNDGDRRPLSHRDMFKLQHITDLQVCKRKKKFFPSPVGLTLFSATKS